MHNGPLTQQWWS